MDITTFNKTCPCWMNQYLYSQREKINLKEKPYNKETLEYLNVLFNQKIMPKIYRLIKMEYTDSDDIIRAMSEFIIYSWHEKMKIEQKNIKQQTDLRIKVKEQ